MTINVSLRRLGAALSLLLCAAPALAAAPATVAPPIPIRVVVLVNFEIGKDSGDTAGEFQRWYERGIDGKHKLDCVPLPMSTHAACLDRAHGVLVTYTGLTADHAAASVMAMGMDPRFDFSKAYWLIGGIAGINPERGTIGSAVWGQWVVNGDWAYEIDPREMPKDWPTGYIPFKHKTPYEQPAGDDNGKVFKLNGKLRNWAYDLTKTIKLDDSDKLRAIRAGYTDDPEARKPPRVMRGDNISANTFWHGKLLNDWATQWVRYWTHDQGQFVTTAVEDSGILEAIRFLDAGGKADFARVMLLRTASNFSMQPNGMTAAESLAREVDGFGALQPACEAHWRVGSAVVRELAEHWSKYENDPFAPASAKQ
ncbi:purine-nucleoside phosphorylase [Solimonas marina]|uniref:Purine nucleoside permease n=1 Tax=Solimonas marina TaxID=2714601 RepID=A0A969WGA1_9GAMM|nr:purine nucleoside permease [Solimonas marina]NKF24751.1 purine nucleoside permease [Solimonas marina]